MSQRDYSNLLFLYLDNLPKIPEHLLDNCYLRSQVGFNDRTYSRFGITDELKAWLTENISHVQDRMGVQVMETDVGPHCDFRHWGVNYIYTTGGPAVTNFLKLKDHDICLGPNVRHSSSDTDSVEILLSLPIEPFRWHLINTHCLHSVKHISDIRQAVTVGLMGNDPFAQLKHMNPGDYAGMM